MCMHYTLYTIHTLQLNENRALKVEGPTFLIIHCASSILMNACYHSFAFKIYDLEQGYVKLHCMFVQNHWPEKKNAMMVWSSTFHTERHWGELNEWKVTYDFHYIKFEYYAIKRQFLFVFSPHFWCCGRVVTHFIIECVCRMYIVHTYLGCLLIYNFAC